MRPLTPWDRGARYFTEGSDVTGVRRGEDISSAAFINASTLHLAYWDRQYRTEVYGYCGVTEEELPDVIANDLLCQIDQLSVDACVIPLGITHPDHRITAEAGLIFADRYRGELYMYEELPYAVEDSAEVADRKRKLIERGFMLAQDSSLEFLDDRALKMAAVRCHSSQRRLLRRRGRTAVRTPERVWKLLHS